MTTASRQVADVNGARYVLTRQLGRGGQGAVFEVKGGRLAAKLIFDTMPSRRERLRNQLTAVKRLDLAGLEIARPLEMLREPALGYVMELLTGMQPLSELSRPPSSSLAEWYIATGGLRRRLALLARTGDVLAALHGKGLVYSDPSPHNIFVSQDVEATEVRLIDSDNIHYASSAGASVVFTPTFGAPELLRRTSGVNSLTDAHAFAVLCFQTLSLVHPLIGDDVANDVPEREEEALAGELPWIDDPSDSSNRCSVGIPRGLTLSPRLADIAQSTFGEALTAPLKRPGVAEWTERLYAAADATIMCPDCRGTYYLNAARCPWCETPRPAIVTAEFRLWDPALGHSSGVRSGPGGQRQRPLSILAFGPGDSRVITRRLAGGHSGREAQREVLGVSFDGARVGLKALDGTAYRLTSPTGSRSAEVGSKPASLLLKEGEASWNLHLGPADRLHRVVSFSLRKASSR